LPLQQVFKG